MITQLQSGKARTLVQALLIPKTAPILLSYPDSLDLFVGRQGGRVLAALPAWRASEEVLGPSEVWEGLAGCVRLWLGASHRVPG